MKTNKYLHARDLVRDVLYALSYLDRQLCNCPQDPEYVDVILRVVDSISEHLNDMAIPVLETVYELLEVVNEDEEEENIFKPA